MKLLLAIFLCSFAYITYAQPLPSRGKAFNPDIGVNALFLDQESKRDKSENGMSLQEAELQFSSDVDAYFTARVLLAIEEEAGEYEISPEEAFVETLQVPYATIKIGKSKMPMGKHNQLHSHAFPFINAPLQNEAILGEEGLSETGVGASGLIPLPWFSELTFDYTQGENEDLFNAGDKGKKAIIGHFKNLWELSDAATIEFGISGAQGTNSDGADTNLAGADFTFKWRPVEGGKYHSFEWATEYLQKDRKGLSADKLSGIVSHLKYQLAQRWWVQYRYDYLGLNQSRSLDPSKRHTALIAFLPSEFSALRLQYETIDDGQAEDERTLSLQFNISIGAHPAHAY
ncbi:MAG: hypothetical protein H6621_11190 [Halobacteriovoraceae bacterium]|nr:hypothetical protein [Halobacteriovoraceae bacterium]MCB9095623.1 hypothetical protein [Halobacteriovoraceae bacterium]